MAREHWIPLSILVGSLIVATGAYLGLREHATASPLSSPTSPTASLTPFPTGTALEPFIPSASARVAPSALPAPSNVETGAEVKKAVEDLRKQIVKSCWVPHEHDKEIPKHLKLIYSGAFDAAGNEIGRGLSDSREAYYLPLSTCARSLPMNLRIAAPGKNISVAEPIEIP